MKLLGIVSVLFFMFGCASVNQPEFEGESLLSIDTFYCPNDTVKYCEGSNRKNMTCGCVSRQSLSNSFDFLR